VSEGDTDGLVGLLAADVVAYGDGGGKSPAFPHPVHGRDPVARVLVGGVRFAARLGASAMRLAVINGQPGALLLNREGRPVLAVSLDIADDLVQTVRGVSNPEKLAHLGTFAGRPLPRS
jgi:RNA polymerase sigma-70 factor (ECF subfamily)